MSDRQFVVIQTDSTAPKNSLPSRTRYLGHDEPFYAQLILRPHLTTEQLRRLLQTVRTHGFVFEEDFTGLDDTELCYSCLGMVFFGQASANQCSRISNLPGVSSCANYFEQ